MNNLAVAEAFDKEMVTVQDESNFFWTHDKQLKSWRAT